MQLIFLLLFFSNEALHRVKVGDPVVFQNEGNPKTFITGIHQLESNGKTLFVLRKRYPSAIEIKANGNFIRNIGGNGNGPGELGFHGPISMAVNGPSTWIVRNDIRAISYYENGKFVASFKPNGYQLARNKLPAYGFSFNKNSILLQAHPGQKVLAYVYDYGGNIRHEIKDLLPIERQFLEINPALNTTSWVRDGAYWWCLFIYRPILRKYDSNFKKIQEFQLYGPEIEDKEEIYFKNEPVPNWQYPKWHFSDFKVFGNSIYILCEGVMYQVDKESGGLKSRTLFLSNKTMREVVDSPIANFHYLAFTDDGKLFLANSFLPYEKDGVWTADLPFDPLKH